MCPASRSEEQSDEMPGYVKGIPGSSKWLGLRAACKEWKKVSRPHPSDHPLLILFVVGGVTVSEAKMIKDLVPSLKPGTQTALQAEPCSWVMAKRPAEACNCGRKVTGRDPSTKYRERPAQETEEDRVTKPTLPSQLFVG
ncbi:hypothetical protein J1605_018397 [Eschrichtius robustus]|uniref:Sec1 family domain-containing protein 2 n=1 Tax=Eschrichtius robustus TaxID=9764 RepID=A0AB34HWF6_ESCRO|nr:hypothetical protein J1605_018397 [Eschrichtius robustus]